jgi:competence protein ComEC
LSLGDVESPILSAGLRSQKTIQRETDILILAHHGADNGFTTKKFIEEVRPSFAVATSNYDNHFEHPRKEIREILYKNKIPLFTTKTGDLIVRSIGGHFGKYVIENYISNGETLSSRQEKTAKKLHFLSQNADTIRNIINRQNRGP